jgi:sugar O-acyltransferase (sialic acid O-acetyltransferase NeuD family)
MIYLLGAGCHSKQVVDIFEENNQKIEGFFDDFKKAGTTFYNYSILGNYNDINEIVDNSNSDSYLFCCLGDNNKRKTITNQFSNYKWINCISSKAHISKTSMIDIGNYIGNFTIINPDCIIGKFNIINDSAVIAHDCKIGDFNHFAHNVSVAGNVSINDCNLFGTSSCIIPKINIGSNNIIGSGTNVIRDIYNNGVHVGNPSKIIKNL